MPEQRIDAGYRSPPAAESWTRELYSLPGLYVGDPQGISMSKQRRNGDAGSQEVAADGVPGLALTHVDGGQNAPLKRANVGEENLPLPDASVFDEQKDKATLLDANASDEDRASAARELVAHGQPTFTAVDKNGVEHRYRLSESDRDGVSFMQLIEDGSDAPKVLFQSAVHPRVQESPVHNRPSRIARPQGMRRSGGAGGGGGGRGGSWNYQRPRGGQDFNPAGVDHSVWKGVKNPDGSVALNFRGCQVDTDGSGAWRHGEDRTRQSHTSLRLSNGQSLDTDRDNFFVLPPSVAHAYGIHKGDLGWLVRQDTGKAVPVVFGDVGPEGKLGEASVKALKDLGFNNVSGANGVSGVDFRIVFVPGSGDGTGDIARDSKAMAAKLSGHGGTADQVS